MFKAELRSDALKGLINVISTLIDEVKFTISPEGISLKAVDPAHVAMVEVTLSKAAFESYQADDTEIGVDIDKVKDVLKLASSGDIISMEQDAEHGRLVFKVGNVTRRMNLVDTSSLGDVRVPPLELAASIEVPVTDLQKGIKASESISDHIALIADSERFELHCDGDTDSVDLVMEASNTVKIDADMKVSSMFPLDYFSNLIKAVPSDLRVKIELDTDYPVRIVFALAEGNGVVKYLLAPRIEKE
ncbi:MAG: proliferating cell nuclear antigen (pcna) [Candidatus Methanomethylophilaceae archaeon]|nr:proliferating cell nuclear antigen (pcna) [Candidatus Methanomethylophilaceae archaeon]MDY5872654.1 proliferating cell nuclear antigen (pcna) [Candidatus Methanomethylophilaceae archaeon]